MSVNTLPDPVATLGSFLRDRRSKLQPGPDVQGRRRTPGLRREEVAARAHVSVVWYTWLEQGRGGPPSSEVLERLAIALELDATGREMLFLLAQQRLPPVNPVELRPISPALQSVLDGMPASPAIVKTPTWDIVAWNQAAMAVLTNFTVLEPRERNVLRRMFSNAEVRAALPDWEEVARLAIAVFRIDVARTGGSPEAVELAAELHESSEDFRRLWADQDVRDHGVGIKRLTHPVLGALELDYSTFSVDGADGLSMVVFTPRSTEQARAISALIASQKAHIAS